MARQDRPEGGADDPPVLDIDIDALCYIIVKAREFDAEVEEDTAEDASDPADDHAIEMLVDNGDDTVLDELKDAIASLNEDEQIILIALVWLGRGDFGIAEWDQAVALAAERHRGDSTSYLTGMPLLGDYLQEGLAAFDRDCSDVERSHL